MFKSIKHFTSAVADLTAIATKETNFQVTRSCDYVTDTTGAIAERAARLRREYEVRLARRKSKGKTLMLEHIPQEQDK